MNDYICYNCKSYIDEAHPKYDTYCKCFLSHLNHQHINPFYLIYIKDSIYVRIYMNDKTSYIFYDFKYYKFDFIFTREYMDYLHNNINNILNYL